MVFRGLLLCLLAALAALPAPAVAAPRDRVWLAASDLHLDPFRAQTQPADFGSDTNAAFFASAIAQMRRAVPDPDVVLLPGDFFAHDFPKLASHAPGAPASGDAAIATMRSIARAFDRAFPHAQFAIAVGNNDATCGDYRNDAGNTYMQEIARAWEPLVNRRGAAPDFLTTYARGGYYQASLPVNGLRLISIDTVLYSHMYRGNCEGASGGAAASQREWLDATLAATPPGTRNVVMMHVPPGFDPFATEFVKGFVAWPFLDSNDNGRLLARIADPSSHVAYVVAGHMHRFDFRMDSGVPILILGSISPVYHNNPAFYALHVGADGALRDVDTYAFDIWSQQWTGSRSFDAKFGTVRIDGGTLAALHARLETDPALRAAWAASADGWPSNPGIAWSTWSAASWRMPWCAQTELKDDSAFASCAGIARRVTFFRIAAPAAIALALVLAILGATAIVRRLRRRKLLGFRR